MWSGMQVCKLSPPFFIKRSRHHFWRHQWSFRMHSTQVSSISIIHNALLDFTFMTADAVKAFTKLWSWNSSSTKALTSDWKFAWVLSNGLSGLNFIRPSICTILSAVSIFTYFSTGKPTRIWLKSTPLAKHCKNGQDLVWSRNLISLPRLFLFRACL